MRHRVEGIIASIIVPARDAAATIVPCLEALRFQARDGGRCELIVVDDGSTDATAVLAREHADRVIAPPAHGPAAARNAGARAATGALLLFIDADCVPEAGCLAALLAPFADPLVAGVRGGYASDQRSSIARFAQLELEEKQDRLASSARIAAIDSACAAYRRDVFARYGGFDERFPATSAEDFELSFRMAAAGELLLYAPGARVRHRHPDRLVTYLRRKLRFGFYRAVIYAEYPGRMRGDGYTPRLMPAQIVVAPLLVATTVLAPRHVAARSLAALALLAFVGLSAPLARRARRTDRGLCPLVPPLLFARSLAQGLGLMAGLVAAGARLTACNRRRGRAPATSWRE